MKIEDLCDMTVAW